LTAPAYFVPEECLLPVSNDAIWMASAPPSRRFLIHQPRKVYRANYPDLHVYAPYRGDGSPSLPGGQHACAAVMSSSVSFCSKLNSRSWGCGCTDTLSAAAKYHDRYG
jgi:hypothetical protein